MLCKQCVCARKYVNSDGLCEYCVGDNAATYYEQVVCDRMDCSALRAENAQFVHDMNNNCWDDEYPDNCGL